MKTEIENELLGLEVRKTNTEYQLNQINDRIELLKLMLNAKLDEETTTSYLGFLKKVIDDERFPLKYKNNPSECYIIGECSGSTSTLRLTRSEFGTICSLTSNINNHGNPALYVYEEVCDWIPELCTDYFKKEILLKDLHPGQIFKFKTDDGIKYIVRTVEGLLLIARVTNSHEYLPPGVHQHYSFNLGVNVGAREVELL